MFFEKINILGKRSDNYIQLYHQILILKVSYQNISWEKKDFKHLFGYFPLLFVIPRHSSQRPFLRLLYRNLIFRIENVCSILAGQFQNFGDFK